MPSKDTQNKAPQADVSSDNTNERQLENPTSDIDYEFPEADSLDENLDEVASRTNLTVINVKNILHVSKQTLDLDPHVPRLS